MKKLLLTMAVLVGAFSLTTDARAGVIAGYSGSAAISQDRTTVRFFMGKGLGTADLDSVYVMLEDDDAALFLYTVHLYECPTAAYGTVNGETTDCGTPMTLYADSLGATFYSVDLTGAGDRTPYRIRFAGPTWHNAFGCVPGPGCLGTMSQAAIVLDDSKFYELVFSFDTSVVDLTPDGSSKVYGIGTQLTDLYGNPVWCAASNSTATNCKDDLSLKTPWTVWTEEDPLTDDELDVWDGDYEPFDNWLVPPSIGSGSDYGLTSSSSVSGQDLGYFGNMLRDLALFLFSPWDESTANAWVNFRNSLSVHIPFSYLAEANEMIQDATVASGSLPVWSYSNSNLGLSSISFFSSATLVSYAPSGFITNLRALAVAGLWLTALWYVFKEVQHLFG